MSSEFVAVMIWLFASYAAGAATGMVVAVALSIHGEVRRGGLWVPARGWVSAGARHANGVGVRGGGPERNLTIR